MNLIIFDIDGTLTDTLDLDDELYRQALSNLFDINLQDEKWEEYKKSSTGTDNGLIHEIFINELKRNPKYGEINQLKLYFTQLLKSKLNDSPKLFKEIPGAVTFFNNMMKSSANKVAVATGSWKESGALKLQSINLTVKNIPYGNSDSLNKRKDIIADVIYQATGVFYRQNFRRIIYFGDGAWDFEASRSLGIDFIGVDSRKTGNLKNLGAGKIIPNYRNHEMIMNLIN